MPNKRSWNDGQLRAAVASSTSYSMVLRHLGLRPGGSHNNVKDRVLQLGLDIGHFTNGPITRSRPWTDELLREAVRSATGYTMVLDQLGLKPINGLANKVRRRASLLGLDTSHFTTKRGPRANRRGRWTDDQLKAAIAVSKSFAGTIRELGLVPAGGNYDSIQGRARELALDTSHFTGGWHMKLRPSPPLPIEDVLVRDRWTASHSLKKRLIREGFKKAACEICGWAVPRPCDGQIPVELDHINGDKNDNRLENLRVLCPNCHSLQPTHRGLNKKSFRK